jgi:hypothetical protein
LTLHPFSIIDFVNLQQVVIEGQDIENANMSQLMNLLPSVVGQYFRFPRTCASLLCSERRIHETGADVIPFDSFLLLKMSENKEWAFRVQ